MKQSILKRIKLSERKIALAVMLAGFSAFNFGFINQAEEVRLSRNATVEETKAEVPAVNENETAAQKTDYADKNGEVVVEPPDETAVEPIDTPDNAVNLTSDNDVDENVDYNDEGFSYTAVMSMEATAYLPNDPGCTGITAIGIPATYGVVAVDPCIIPLGSRVYIPGYGEAIAADTGGAIYGYRIDLCMENYYEAMDFGRRTVTVYVLD